MKVLYTDKSGAYPTFYSEWLPTANYVRDAGANFEIYGGDREYGYIELWFPINKLTSRKEHNTKPSTFVD